MFTTGTDEHGLKVQEAAEAKGMDPKLFCDHVSKSFRDAFELAHIKFDRFVRTTDDDHALAVQAMWKRLLRSGDLYKGTHEGWYCSSDEVFVPENMVEEVPASEGCDRTGEKKVISSESGKPLRWVSEENWKFRLSAYEERLLAWLDGEGGPDSPVFPPKRTNEVRQLIKQGLRDISVSRLSEKVPWALPVPDDDEHSIYVWVDALTNYLTVTGFGTLWGHTNEAADVVTPSEEGNFWPAHCHVIGKDILRFHCVYWPAFLMAAGLPLPKRVVAHGHWTIERVKMSKSLGNVVAPKELIENYGLEPVRYFLLREGNLSIDADFSASAMEQRVNSELADTLGNLVTRCTGKAMLPEAAVPCCMFNNSGTAFNSGSSNKDLRALAPDSMSASDLDDHVAMATMVNQVSKKVGAHFDGMQFDAGLDEIMSLLRDMNAYFQRHEPWALQKLIKEGNATNVDRENLSTTLYNVLESLRVTGILLQPVIPSSAGRMLDFLGVGESQIRERSILSACYSTQQAGRKVGGQKEGQQEGKNRFVFYAKK